MAGGTPHTIAPPNYRKADINPMPPLLADKGIVDGSPTVNLVSGDPDFGNFGASFSRVFQFDFTSYTTTELGRLVPLVVVYSGDLGFNLLTIKQNGDSGDGIVANYVLPSPSMWEVCVPGSNEGHPLEIQIGVLADAPGVTKVATLTFYDRFSLIMPSLNHVALTVTLSKTYDP